MSEVYGAQFANQYGAVGGEAFQTWCLGLRDLQPEQIKRGFARLLEREKTFVPNLNEFRRLCVIALVDLGLPELDQAYREVCDNSHSPLAAKWSHAGVYHAGRVVGWFELRGEPRDKTFPAFKRAYQQIVERLSKGEVFELPELDCNALEQHEHGKQVKTEENKRVGSAALAALKQGFKGL